MATTSGTVSTTVFKTNKLVEHAFRRCKVPPEKLTPQNLQVALDCLYLIFSDMANKGINLWTIQRDILPLYQGLYQLDCPAGSVDMLNVNLRDLQRIEGIYSSTEGNAALAFDSDVETSCTQTTPGGNITAQFSDGTSITTIGILFHTTNSSLSFVIETSSDGSTWNSVYTNTGYSATAGEWLWVDLDDPGTTLQSTYQNDIFYCRIRAVSPSILDIDEFVIANTPREIEMALINRDDYANLPDHTFQGRPVQYWYNVQINPQLWIWPAADAASVYRQVIMYRTRYIQDVGSLGQLVEIPQRWFNSIIWSLSMLLCDSIQEVPSGRKEEIRPDSDRASSEAWNQETDRSPIFFRPNISPYTR